VFERYSQRARQVIVLAQQEARELGHDYIGTEHLLIAVLRPEVGVTPSVLASVGLTAEEGRAAVIAIAGRGEAMSQGMVPFTPHAQRTVELGLKEALWLGRPEVDPEHVLLALLAEDEGVAARILVDAGADRAAIRAGLVGVYVDRPEVPATAPPVEMLPELDVELGWRGRPIALAALGAAVLARSAFDPRRTGLLGPIEMELLVHLALLARTNSEGPPGDDVDALQLALACDRDDFKLAVQSLLREGLVVDPAGLDEDRLAITAAGAARVEEWLRRTVPLFGGWPPTIAGVDDV
jgi:Clp amino terminal domain, pathogenicity island component